MKDNKMVEGSEQIYETIATSMINAIPEEWETATIEAVFFPEMSRYIGEYTRKPDGVARDFATKMDAQRAIRELRSRFKEAGKPLWGRVRFDVKADGEFKMKYGYDDCDANGDAIFDEENESKKHEERFKRLTS